MIVSIFGLFGTKNPAESLSCPQFLTPRFLKQSVSTYEAENKHFESKGKAQ
jgi:hypothetical protein